MHPVRPASRGAGLVLVDEWGTAWATTATT